MQYGNTIENRNLITVKAKEKGDGVYQFRGVAYRVRDNRVTHVACNGQVLESFGNFDVKVGIYEGYSDAAKKILRSI